MLSLVSPIVGNGIMRCPKCHSVEDKVIDSRIAREGASIRRRRECLECGHRFTTYEHVEEADILVVKRNGAREPLDREKLLRGLFKACEKRPVPRESLERAVDEIVLELQSQNAKEVPTKLIGLKVMEKLQHLDPVAYVRYASVYRQFQDVGEFLEEIQHLERRIPRLAQQPEFFS
jgi:transcriptional repressor NrdR